MSISVLMLITLRILKNVSFVKTEYINEIATWGKFAWNDNDWLGLLDCKIAKRFSYEIVNYFRQLVNDSIFAYHYHIVCF